MWLCVTLRRQVTMQQGINECFALVQSLDLPRGTLEVYPLLTKGRPAEHAAAGVSRV